MKIISFIIFLFFCTLPICLAQKNGDSLFLNTVSKKEAAFFKSKKIAKLKAALKQVRIVKNNAETLVILNKLGNAYNQQDNIREALNYHQEALDIIANIKSKNNDVKHSASIAINSIATIYISLKQYERALDLFNQSIPIQEEIGNISGLASSYQQRGLAYQKIGNLDKALADFKKSLGYNTLNKDKLVMIICHNSIANVLIIKGQYKAAHSCLVEIQTLAEDIGNSDILSKVYSSLGWVFLKLKEDKKADYYLKKSLEIGLKDTNLSNLENCYNHLSELNKQTENYKAALNYYQKSIEIAKKRFNNKDIRYVNSLINKCDIEVSANKIKSLAIENKIAKIKNIRNRNILIIVLMLLAFFGFLLYSMYRQRLLKNEKQILLLEQKTLRIQMNPHFVFNALNSIKLYIINNEQKNAVYYLNKFSKLMRNILESTIIKEVTLSEELRTMNLYMSIENIRLSNAIIYTQTINESVNLERIKVPPLILQPFLENAIWHGLSSKIGSKKLEISVVKIAKEFIKIEIEDNGIGRKEALRIKNNKTLNRKSIGIYLTKERLKNFSTQFQNEYSLVYIDLVDENGKAKGTKVSLKIPLH
ncbi:tetratricopeptide repeat-containing sensor histidine kinase [Tenacibaculum finnmarkense]|uniref:tetratricopeptide repeat-containing sensor histidine kinase n=1 Tax=Tenacibaculum finnmarkense TaxID=2781243 RepID=UPI001E631177|nr:tetratricopeptide repeat protein [Tenacibaculum finnmarkense]MCD8402331.1 tetratricopeptide repeat protein [Tenacibaculum finnmarkense genomovar finnmarkense]MCD8446604.1 tetratricopeptide repeat protein [Tenacibaculum finnmarkense genomovar finnmarkense]